MMKKNLNGRIAALCICGVTMCSVVTAFPMAIGRANAAVISGASTDLEADAATDVAAMSKYESAIRTLLYDQKFADLDRIATADREGKTKFAGGVWKLYIFYQGLKLPAEGMGASEEVWDKHMSALAAWAAANRESATARIALGEALLNYSAKLQNDADNRRVEDVNKGEDTWRHIRDVQHMRDLILKEASSLKTKCPHYYFVMLEIQERRTERETADSQFEQAIAFEPTYFPYYRLHALYHRAEWDGDDGEAEKFADDMSKRVGGQQGAAIYFEIAAALNCSPSTRRFKTASLPWERIREGYAALQELYGPSLYKMNQFAYLAIRYDKIAEAGQVFEQIGDRGDEYTWGSMKFFQFNRSWVVAPPEILDLRKKADANAETTEGHKYHDQIKNEVGYKFIPSIRRCMGAPSKEPAEGWDLFFRIGVKGEIEEVKSWPKTAFTECVVPDFKGNFSAPPSASSYWVKISAEPFLGFE
jgi:hypothetical protein